MLGYETQFWIMWAALVQAAGVGTQCVLIYMGFNTMRRANDLRSRQLAAQEKARDAQHEQTMKAFEENSRRDDEIFKQNTMRHEESMAALRELIRQNHELEKQNAKRHEENMMAWRELTKENNELVKQNAKQHEENMAALKTLIERTAPAA